VLEASLVPSRLLGDTAATAVAVALIAALGSIVATIVGQVLSRRADKDLRDRTSVLEDRVDEARRDYIYEARKRLYEECEPLLFQTIELVETARDRIVSLARSSRSGSIRADGSGWLAQRGYYFTSSVFHLFGPMTSFKLVQRRLTAVDLRIEPKIREQYELLKVLFLSFTRDFDLAWREPALQYDPDRADPGSPERERLLRDRPDVYSRQGLYRGTMDIVVEALIRTDGRSTNGKGGDVERCTTLGEFLTEFFEPESPTSAIRTELDELFLGFHPGSRPVLWRVLVAQLLLYDAFLGVESDPAELERLLDCGDEATEESSTTLTAARAFVEPELARIKGLVPTAP
jgi:hypothetical protein